MILFLDDDLVSNTIWATTTEEAITTLRDYDIDEAHLDHDLGGETYVHSGREDCGMEVVRWIEKLDNLKKFEKTLFVCHSWNLDAGRKMMERLTKLGLRATQLPFGMGR
jgi:hypothetical protein